MTINEIALKYPTDQSSVFHDYLDFLGEIFEPLRDKPITLMEQGCLAGGMLSAYSDYFVNEHRKIVGVDIQDWTKHWGDASHTPKAVDFWVGSQTDSALMAKLNEKYGGWNIIIDDAGHFARAQMEAFALNWQYVKKGGYYIIEDIHTAWSKQHCDANITITEWLHRLEDELHGKGPDASAKILPTDKWATIHSITIRKGIAVIRKNK